MCTVSLSKTQNGYRVFMNRDERNDRIPEEAPSMLDEKHGVYGPRDPQGGGTWIAHDHRGYWGCILNGYTGNEIPRSNSRGLILPYLISQRNPLDEAKAFNPYGYNSFRLLIGSPETHFLLNWDGHRYTEGKFHGNHEDRLFFLSSSSFMQEEVIDARTKLFYNWARRLKAEPLNTPDFHYSEEPSPAYAPLMTRETTSTKSITSMMVTASGGEMTHTLIEQGSQARELALT